MLNKIKNFRKILEWHGWGLMRDVRFLGLMVFGVLVLLASWSGVKVIETNFELQKQVARLDQENQVQQLSNENLKLRNEYYKTDTYIELTARKQFGRGAAGETLLLVPKSVALAKAKQLPSTVVETTTNNQTNKPKYRQNFDAWMRFLFRKST